jgi:ATP-dependent DNA ligase
MPTPFSGNNPNLLAELRRRARRSGPASAADRGAESRTRPAAARSPSGHRAQHALLGDGDIVYQQAYKLGCEGIVSKRLGSTYCSGRSGISLKFKNPAAPAVRREAEEGLGALN